MQQSIPLDYQSIIEEASQRSGGLNDLGADYFNVGLNKVLESLESEARLNEMGRLVARERMIGHTINRLLYVNDRKLYPGIAEETIESPVIIVGNPRTGTTILHDMLAQDINNRVPLTWECTFPSPPPETSTYKTDPRIEQCRAQFAALDAMPEGFKAVHPMDAELSQECVVLFADTMVTQLFHNQFRVPSYQDWVDQEADFGPVYDFHYQQLQHLQHRCKGDRWVLKTGAHNWRLDCLLARYPDAKLVFTHRDPVKAMTSYASLTEMVRKIGSDHVDPVEIAKDWVPRLANIANRSVEVRKAHEDSKAQIYDMFFSDFVSDQFSEIERIYDALDINMSGESADRIRAFIASNPKGVHGVHEYREEDYGIVPDEVRELFKPYLQHFDISSES